MYRFPFCPNSECALHHKAPGSSWFVSAGCHHTKAFGVVPRFRCRVCGKSFSTQTFSLDYYAKRVIAYDDLLKRHVGSESLRAISRCIGVSCNTVQNRLERLARQAIALHATLLPLAATNENVCIDGFVSFDQSQYFPNEITVAITSDSRFILDVSHATKRRSGVMTKTQRAKRALLDQKTVFERHAVKRTFSDILDTLASNRPPRLFQPLVLVTDEKKEYNQVLHASRLWRSQDEEHRIAHITITSTLPKTYANPLFASNYLDREIRKDQANHRRETSCFCRNVAKGMLRLVLYLIDHNYRKRFSIKARSSDTRVHAQIAGIDKAPIALELRKMFCERAFITNLSLPKTLDRIWRKRFTTPLKHSPEYLPAFTLA